MNAPDLATTGPGLPGSAAAPPRVAALDVGGTVLKGAVFEVGTGADAGVGAAGTGVRQVATLRRPTPRAEGADAIVAAVLDTVAELCALAPDVGAVGLVVPGVVDEAAGIGVESENLFWRDVPFARLAAERAGRPVAFGHDVRAGGRAELAALAGPPPTEALVMLVGTGIAGLLVVGGRVLPGAYVGEIGHAPVGPDEPCACGSTGCLETIASAASIARRYREAGGPVVAGSREVLAAAQAGDSRAGRVWGEAVDALVRGLAIYTTLLAPEVVVLGGGLALAGAALLDPVTAGLAARLTFQPVPELRLGQLGDEAGTIGAALLARDLLLAG
jgi:glucokinase